MKHCLLAVLVLLLGVSIPSAAAPTTPPPEKPVVARHPAISVFRMTFDGPHGAAGPPFRFGVGAVSMGGFPQARGTVWLANNTLDDLSDVRMTVGFYSLRFYHRTGDERSYTVGKLAPKQTEAVNFAVDVTSGERVVPYVDIVYRDQGKLYRTSAYPYGN